MVALPVADVILGLRAARGVGWTLLALLWACATGSDDPTMPGPPVLSGSGPGSGPTSAGSGVDSATSMATGETDQGTQGETGGLDSTGTDASSDGPPTTDGSTGDPAPMCPPEAEDTPCVVCGKEQCCPEYTACLADEGCICALDCYLGGLPTEDCIAMCGITVAAVDLFNCASVACSDVCM